MRRTKIVCTIGPATQSAEQLAALAEAGMNVARLNFSHGSHDWHRERFRLIRDVAREIGRPIAILQDLSGPKLRIGEVPKPGIELLDGRQCVLTHDETSAGDVPSLEVPVPGFLEALQPGVCVYIDDGNIELSVLGREGDNVVTRVARGGMVSTHKGITAPKVTLPIPAATEKDLEDLALGLELGVDYVAVSFVRRASDLDPVRKAIQDAGQDIPIIAKIERPEAVENLAEILAAANGIMVARGDLGVETPIHQVPIVQKEIIRRANRVGKPVITATQMLESMTRNPRPTRAEVSDVANAILDGTDAVMLSGETAVGDFPNDAVEMMGKIAAYTEPHMDHAARLRTFLDTRADSITDAISQGTNEIAADLGATAILCSTTSGYTARMVSRTRPRMRVVAATARETTYRRLALVWGVQPLLVNPTTNTDEMLTATVDGARKAGWISAGDTVVVASGVPVGSPGHTNLIKVQRVGEG